MSSELSRSSSPKWIAAAVALVFASAAIGCVGPDAFNRDAGPIQTGAGGNDGFAGQTGSGGSGAGGAAAMGGQTGSGGSGTGGKTGAGGSAMGGAPGAGGRTGSGGSAMGGAPGMGGRGMGGAGMGGAIVTDGGADGDAAGAGGMGMVDAGMGGAGGGTVVFSDNFESDMLGGQPTTWTRTGGSAGDWAIVSDGTQGLAQNHAQSSTFRAQASMGQPPTPNPPGAPWGGATTLAAQVKITLNGSSTPTTAFACVRYTDNSHFDCLALLAGVGAQIQVANGGAPAISPTLSATITVGTTYNVQLSIDATGLLRASLNGTTLGNFMPTSSIANGFVAVATQNAEATFDNIVVTQP